MRTSMLALAAALTLAGGALAAQPKKLALPLGHTATMSMPGPVSQVTVDDPSLVEVSKEGRRVVFTARGTGRTEVTVTTTEGELRVQIYVAADKYGMPY